MKRLLFNWDPLKIFLEEKKKTASAYATSKVEAIFDFLRSPTNKLYVLFQDYTFEVFEEFIFWHFKRKNAKYTYSGVASGN